MKKFIFRYHCERCYSKTAKNVIIACPELLGTHCFKCVRIIISQNKDKIDILKTINKNLKKLLGTK